MYLFDWLTSWGLSMGLVLLLLTIIVKTIVYPFTYKSYVSSAKMRALKPYIDAINAKYPKQEDAMKKQQEKDAIQQIWSKPNGWMSAHAHTDARIHSHVQLCT